MTTSHCHGIRSFFAVGVVMLAFLTTLHVVSGQMTSSGSALNLTGVDIFAKIWGPGSNGIILGGGLNFSTQVGVGWSQQYGGMFVTSYSMQSSQTNYYLAQTTATNISVTGPVGSVIEVFDLETLKVVATNLSSPGSAVVFSAQPSHRYGGFAWYADNSQKSIEIMAVLATAGTTTTPPPITPPPAATADVTAPSVPANVTATALAADRIKVSWSPSTDAVGVTGYKIFRNGTEILSQATSSSLLTLLYTDSALTSLTSYSYTVSAYDAAGNSSSQSSAVSATTLAVAPSPPPPPAAQAFTISNINSYSRDFWVYVEFTTGVPVNKRRLWIGESPGAYATTIDWGCASPEESSFLYRTDHCIHLSYRKANTTYYYKLDATDASGNQVTSPEYSITIGSIPTYTTAPAISNIQVVNITGTSATITWTTDQLTTTMVNYGPPAVMGWYASDSRLTKSHSKTLTGLSPNTSYSFKVSSTNSSDNPNINQSTSPLQSFTTSSTTTTPPPTTSPTTPPPSTTSTTTTTTTTTSSTNGSALNLTGVDIFAKIWGPGSNGIILGGGLNFSTQVGVGWSQQYGGMFVTSYSMQSSQTNYYLAQTTATNISVTGPVGSVIEVFDLETLKVVATNLSSPGSAVVFSAQPSHRYGGFAWYADNSQKSIEIMAVLATAGTTTTPPPITPPPVMMTATTTTSTPPPTTLPPTTTTIPLGCPIGFHYMSEMGGFCMNNENNYSGICYTSTGSTRISCPTPTTTTTTVAKAAKSLRVKVVLDDGTPATDATVTANQKLSGMSVQGQKEAPGSYTYLLTGGTWDVWVWSFGGLTTWSPPSTASSVIFLNDDSVETREITITVKRTSATVTGSVVGPGSMLLPQGSYWITLYNAAGKGFPGSFDATGAFSVAVAAGTYTVNVGSTNSKYTPPGNIPSVTVTAEEKTKYIGVIAFTAQKENIVGQVLDTSGNPLTGIEVQGWKSESPEYSYAKTDATGSFTLMVSAGPWNISASPNHGGVFINQNPPQHVVVVPGIPAKVFFALASAKAGVWGTLVDALGNPVLDAYGFANLSKESVLGSTPDSYAQTGGGPIEKGAFAFNAPAGTYTLRVFLPADSLYTALAPQIVVLKDGVTTNVQVGVSKNSSVIKGVLQTSDGVPVTGVGAHVFATSKNGGWQEIFVDKTTGAYELRVAPGVWYLGYDILSTVGFSTQSRPDVSLNVAAGATVVQNLVVERARSTIGGSVLNPSGSGVSNVFVALSRGGITDAISGTQITGDLFVGDAMTDSKGFYSISVPPGSYYVKTFVRPDSGYINAVEQLVTVADIATKTANLELRTTSQAIMGRVMAEEKGVPHAFVWARSKTGGYQETMTDASGAYKLAVIKNENWSIAATAALAGKFYKSGEVSIDVLSENVTQDIILTGAQNLPPPSVVSSAVSKPTVVEVSGGGPSVIAPANSFAGAPGGSQEVSVSVSPDTRVPSQGNVKVVGTAYDFEARDGAGKVISSFNTPVTISMPYDEKEAIALGTNEANLILSFWDEVSGSWKTIENSVVNPETNTVTAAVDHFTRFAIVAAADIVPPANPTNVAAVAQGEGKIALSWTNPLKDFEHAKVYRSEDPTKLGLIKAAEVFANMYVDADDVTDGKMYYYIVRAVDPSGNESNTKTAVTIQAIGTSGKKLLAVAQTGVPQISPTPLAQALARNLKSGDQGADVTTLQQLLVTEGVYPGGKVTGYFGPSTKQAVARFQEKYASSILAPAGLSRGSGIVGAMTRAKMNELLSGKSVSSTPTVPVLKPAGAGSLTWSLRLGLRGDDVKKMQELLAKEVAFESEASGYFGELTKAAVVRFQEKYASEILTPAGLTRGTGMVGPATLKKLNALLK